MTDSGTFGFDIMYKYFSSLWLVVEREFAMHDVVHILAELRLPCFHKRL